MSVEIQNQYIRIGPANEVLEYEGQLGVMLEKYQEHIVMRTYTGLVDLTDAGQTFPKECSNRVGVLPEGTKITYTSEV